MKNCKTYQRDITAYLHGELADRDFQTLEVHLESCAACRAELNAQRATLELLAATLEAAPAPERLVVWKPSHKPIHPQSVFTRPWLWGVMGVSAMATAFLLLSGMFVLFTVVKRQEVCFSPPQAVERSKMELKKPKVRVKKSAKPNMRIVIKVNRASIPDIQLLDMSRMGVGAVSVFDMVTDLDSVNFFGDASESIEVCSNYFGSTTVAGKKMVPQKTQTMDMKMPQFSSLWQSHSPDTGRYYLGNGTSIVGDWITLEAGVPLDMQVLIGNNFEAGGKRDRDSTFCAMLLVEVQGVKYEKNRQGGSILPNFKIEEPSRDLLDAIYREYVPGEVCITNGPVFSDFETVIMERTNEVETVVASCAPVDSSGSGTRQWMGIDGWMLDAKFVTVIGDKAVLEGLQGKMRKIPLSRFSVADREFIELSRPPVFNIDFVRKTSQRVKQADPNSGIIPSIILDHIFSVKLKQISAGPYNHELKVEFFAVGFEVDGGRFILLDRQESSFVPSRKNKRSHTFSGDSVPVFTYTLDGEVRGLKYYGYLVRVTDKRGKTIQHSESNKWLFEHLDNLEKIPKGKYMDKTCTRVYPTAPKATQY